MNEAVRRSEEQIISLFPDRETLVCQGGEMKSGLSLQGGISRQAFTEPVCTAAIKRRRNPPKNRRIENGFTE